MAKARVCDRCGITVTDYFYDVTVYAADIQRNNERFKSQDTNDFELCTDCMNDLKNFFRNGIKK